MAHTKMQCSLKKLPTVVFLLLNLGTATWAAQYRYQYPYTDDEESAREGKIFPLWEGFERGLKDTADMFSRVSDNLELTFDQISNDFEDNISSFADKVGKSVQDSISPYLRENQRILPPGQEPFEVNAVGGSLGGLDDGLTVYYPGEDVGIDNPEHINIPKPDGEEIRGKDRVTGQFAPPSRFNPFSPFVGSNIFTIFKRVKPWWQSSNVCVEREEIDEKETNTNYTGQVEFEIDVPIEIEMDTETTTERQKSNTDSFKERVIDGISANFQMSSCKDSRDKYTCITSTGQKGMYKTVKVTYRCCHGFVRDGYGCSKIDIFPMPETLDKLSSTTDFLSLIKAANMTRLLVDSNLTLFVPNNEAIQEYTADMEEKNEIHNNIDGALNEFSFRRKRETHSLVPVLLAHMANGFLYAGDFNDEQVIPSLMDASMLRLNIYSSFPPLVTVNCARVVAANHHSKNGVVHTIDRVLEPVKKSIADIITSDPQFAILKQLLKNTGLVEELGEEGQLTLFAPTDAAFRRLKPAILTSLLEGRPCLDSVLKYHILPNTICSTAIQGRMKTENKLNDFMVVERNEEDKLFVEDAQIVAKDIMATNGVVHIIDKALMPNQAKSVSDVLEFHNMTKFLELLTAADLLDEFDTQDDITVFAPSNKALEKIPEEDFNSLKNNKERLQELLRYHVTTPLLTAKDINNNHIIDTVAGHPLRMNLYSGSPFFFGILGARRRHPVRVTAGCSKISVLDSRACGAVVHIIEDMLEIPKSNILEALDDEDYSIFKRMIIESGMDQKLSEEGPYTLLAPSDHAFKTLPEEELRELLENEDFREKTVQRHILQEHVCCSGINPNNWLFMDRKRTLDGAQIHIRRSPNGRLMVGPARITNCGSPTGNGIVHTLNRMVVDDREINQMLGKGEVDNNKPVFSFPGFGKVFIF